MAEVSDYLTTEEHGSWAAPECEDCGEPQDGSPGHVRRVRCRACGLLVCRWCFDRNHDPVPGASCSPRSTRR